LMSVFWGGLTDRFFLVIWNFFSLMLNILSSFDHPMGFQNTLSIT
jgi:hypothetical protein